MKNFQRLLLLTTAAALAPLGLMRAADPAPARIERTEVIFLESERFTDVRDSWTGTDRGRGDILDQLKDHLAQRAELRLPTGTRLRVVVTDVDLAGDFEPHRGISFHDVRVVKSVYPPTIRLSFQLTDSEGNRVKEGSRVLRNLAYQSTLVGDRHDALRYEKELLNEWLRAEFGLVRKT